MNSDRLPFVSRRLVFVVATTAMAGVLGLVAAATVHFLVTPLSVIQFSISIAGFATFGFLVSAADTASPKRRAALESAFASLPLTRREKVLWAAAVAVMLATLFLSVHHNA